MHLDIPNLQGEEKCCQNRGFEHLQLTEGNLHPLAKGPAQICECLCSDIRCPRKATSSHSSSPFLELCFSNPHTPGPKEKISKIKTSILHSAPPQIPPEGKKISVARAFMFAFGKGDRMKTDFAVRASHGEDKVLFSQAASLVSLEKLT